MLGLARQVYRAGGLGDAADALAELPEGGRHLGVAEVEAVGQAHRARADRGHVADRLGHGVLPADTRVHAPIPRVAVDRQGHAPGLAGQRREHARVALARPQHRAALDLGVVVAIDRLARGEVRAGQQALEQAVEVGRQLGGRLALGPLARRLLAVVEDAFGHVTDVRIADGLALVDEDVAPVVGHLADDRGARALVDLGQRPLLVVDAQDRRREVPRHGPDEALLGLGAGDDLGLQVVQCDRHEVQVDPRAVAAVGAQLRAGAGDARRAEVLHADRHTGGEGGLAHGLVGLVEDQDVLQEWVRHLHRAAVELLVLVVEGDRGERRAAKARVVGRLADEDQVVGLVLRLGGHAAVDDPALADDAQRDNVDQAVVVITRVEVDIATQAGHAERVRVLPYAVDHALDDPARAVGEGALGVAKTERIGHADDVRAHAIDVADDAADAGRRALDGQDLARVVVALVGDDDAPAVAVTGIAQQQDARVLLGALDDGRAVDGEELLEGRAAGLVAAVLRPLGVEQVDLGQGRVAAQQLGHAADLVGRQAEPVVRQGGGQARLVWVILQAETTRCQRRPSRHLTTSEHPSILPRPPLAPNTAAARRRFGSLAAVRLE